MGDEWWERRMTKGGKWAQSTGGRRIRGLWWRLVPMTRLAADGSIGAVDLLMLTYVRWLHSAHKHTHFSFRGDMRWVGRDQKDCFWNGHGNRSPVGIKGVEMECELGKEWETKSRHWIWATFMKQSGLWLRSLVSFLRRSAQLLTLNLTWFWWIYKRASRKHPWLEESRALVLFLSWLRADKCGKISHCHLNSWHRMYRHNYNKLCQMLMHQTGTSYRLLLLCINK